MQISKEQQEALLQIGYDAHYQGRNINNVADWLRDDKEMHVIICTNTNHDGWVAAIQLKGQHEPVEVIDEDNACKTHYLALSAAITHAISLLTNKNG